MDAFLLILTLVFSGLSVASAVASAWFARKNNVRELENDVEEIAGVVEKVYRESKRQQMRRVRAAAENDGIPIPPGAEHISPPVPQMNDKAALRRAVFGGNKQ